MFSFRVWFVERKLKWNRMDILRFKISLKKLIIKNIKNILDYFGEIILLEFILYDEVFLFFDWYDKNNWSLNLGVIIVDDYWVE